MAFAKYGGDGAEGGLVEQKLHLNPARKYDPARGGDDGEGAGYSMLGESCMGADEGWKGYHAYWPDSIAVQMNNKVKVHWTWHLNRNRLLAARMETFKGVPKGNAETTAIERELAGDRGALRYAD